MNVKIVRFFNGGDNNYRCKEVKVQCSNDNVTWIDATDVITLQNVSKDNYFTEFKIDEPYQYWMVIILIIVDVQVCNFMDIKNNNYK